MASDLASYLRIEERELEAAELSTPGSATGCEVLARP